MKKLPPILLVISLITLIACAPKAPATPSTPPAVVDTSTLAKDETFAGLIDAVPANITWYSPEDLPSDSGVSATIRDDDGLRLEINGTVMPVWDASTESDDTPVWKMSNGYIADYKTNPVDFAHGEVGASGIKGGTLEQDVIVYVRQVNGSWEVGLVK